LFLPSLYALWYRKRLVERGDEVGKVAPATERAQRPAAHDGDRHRRPESRAHGSTRRDAIVEATVRRARPVILTALAAILAAE
jgi:hypothetical protein